MLAFAVPFTSLKKLCKNASPKQILLSQKAYFDSSWSNFNLQSHILSTSGDVLIRAIKIPLQSPQTPTTPPPPNCQSPTLPRLCRISTTVGRRYHPADQSPPKPLLARDKRRAPRTTTRDSAANCARADSRRALILNQISSEICAWQIAFVCYNSSSNCEFCLKEE
jgi:hypothetical protein